MTGQGHLLPMYRDLVIVGAGPQLDDLADRISEHLTAPWFRDLEHENAPHARGFTYRIFERFGDDVRPGLRVFLAAVDSNIVVPNIVPSQRSSLTTDEYNDALLEFVNAFLEPAATEMDLQVFISNDTLDLAETLPDDVYGALVAFSAAANKATGSSHPSDRHRWFRFIHACSDDQVQIDPTVLGRWLEADGWSPEEAMDLVIEFEFGVGLLDYGG